MQWQMIPCISFIFNELNFFCKSICNVSQSGYFSGVLFVPLNPECLHLPENPFPVPHELSGAVGMHARGGTV